MLRLLSIVAAATLGATAAHAVAPPSHIYEFDSSLSEAAGGPAMTVGGGSSFSGTGPQGGLRFAANQGPSLTGGFANGGLYSVEMYFSLDQVGMYRRVLDFKDGSDYGLYLNRGDLEFWHVAGASYNSTYNAGDMIHLVLTRDADEVFRAYLGGREVFSFDDSSLEAASFTAPGGVAHFFRDDGLEASSGFVDFIRTYDRVLTPGEVGELYAGGQPLRSFTASAVPEPDAWALMILGFGVLGSALRGRRRQGLGSLPG